MRAADALLEAFEHEIESLTLVPSKGGVFEVVAGDELVYSKKATGRHAELDEILEPVRSLLAR